MSRRDLEQAFPGGVYNYPGMSLRDYFAGQAMASMGQWTPHPGQFLVTADGMEGRARWAYEQADAMLKARES